MARPRGVIAVVGATGLKGRAVVGRPLETGSFRAANVGDVARQVGVGHVVYSSAGVGVAGTGVGSWETKLAVGAHL